MAKWKRNWKKVGIQCVITAIISLLFTMAAVSPPMADNDFRVGRPDAALGLDPLASFPIVYGIVFAVVGGVMLAANWYIARSKSHDDR